MLSVCSWFYVTCLCVVGVGRPAAASCYNDSKFRLPFLKTCPIYSSDMTGLLQEAAVAATTGHKRPTAASDEVKLPFYLL